MRALVCVVFSLLTTASLYQPPTSLVLREGGGESASFASRTQSVHDTRPPRAPAPRRAGDTRTGRLHSRGHRRTYARERYSYHWGAAPPSGLGVVVRVRLSYRSYVVLRRFAVLKRDSCECSYIVCGVIRASEPVCR